MSMRMRAFGITPGEYPSGRGVWTDDGGAGRASVLVTARFGGAGVLGWGLVHEAGNRSTQRRGPPEQP
jgi:hypothetical protein